jgi:hypothetical protein
VTAERDIKYILSRFEKEGYSFLGVTLPTFAKDVERLLAGNGGGDKLFLGFSSRKGQCLPKFLSGFTSLIFFEDGTVREDADPFAIYAVRQICLAWAKCEFPMTQIMMDSGAKRYLRTEKELRAWDASFSDETLDFVRLSQVFDLLFRDSLNRLADFIYENELQPRHGPGYTASHAIGNSKWFDLYWTSRLERLFPYQEFIRASVHHNLDCDEPTLLSPSDEHPVRVTFVPKTIDKCRTIAMEPTSMMYMQQALAAAFIGCFDSRSSYGRVSDFFNIRDQELNRSLAKQGSSEGSLATLDLSDASDRVSNQLVRALLRKYPIVLDALDATRSRKADVQGKVIRLSKYASMGSALCFVIESMVFLAIAATACLLTKQVRGHSHLPIGPDDIQALIGSVSVYGDDIILPVDAATTAVSLLERFAFKVNDRKSFWTGKFRESCGADWYDGTDISISRLRQPIPTVGSDAGSIISLVEFRNSLFQKRGLWKTAEYLDGIIESKLRFFPAVNSDTSQVLGAHTFCDPFLGPDVYWDTRLHRHVVRGMKVKARPPINSVDGWDALLKFFIERGSDPLPYDGLVRSGRPTSVRLNAGWGSPK